MRAQQHLEQTIIIGVSHGAGSYTWQACGTQRSVILTQVHEKKVWVNVMKSVQYQWKREGGGAQCHQECVCVWHMLILLQLLCDSKYQSQLCNQLTTAVTMRALCRLRLFPSIWYTGISLNMEGCSPLSDCMVLSASVELLLAQASMSLTISRWVSESKACGSRKTQKCWGFSAKTCDQQVTKGEMLPSLVNFCGSSQATQQI